jgi:homoserine dehydrogenase
MQDVNVGIVGLGNVGSGAMTILAENADQIALKLGFRLKVAALCSLDVHTQQIPETLSGALKTTDWKQVVSHPDVQIVVELIGGTTIAAEIIGGAIENGKSVVTANKELMASCGADLVERAIRAGVNLAMEASVCGGIPIHAVLREGISGDRIMAFHGILNGTCNYILTEMENHGGALDAVLAEAQRLGYAEAPIAVIRGGHRINGVVSVRVQRDVVEVKLVGVVPELVRDDARRDVQLFAHDDPVAIVHDRPEVHQQQCEEHDVPLR